MLYIADVVIAFSLSISIFQIMSGEPAKIIERSFEICFMLQLEVTIDNQSI